MGDEAPTIIDYASPAARWGITLQRHAGGLRVTIPTPTSQSYLVSLSAAAVLLCGSVAARILFSSKPSTALLAAPQTAAIAIWAGSAVAGALLAAVSRSRKRMVLDVTLNEFTVAFVSPSGRGYQARWPRQEIGDVKLNSFSGNLLIRVTGKHMLEFPVCRDRQAVKWIADTVRAAVFAADFTASAPFDGLDVLPATRPPILGPRVRAVLFAAAMLLAGAGLVLLARGSVIGAIGASPGLFALSVLSSLKDERDFVA